MKAYFIPGLGADKKAFYKLKLPSGYEAVYLEWISPVGNETLRDYALRLSSSIHAGEDFILIGLSLGGMIASEIARVKTPRKLILLSSVAVSDELPWYFRLAGRLQIHRMIPVTVYKKATLLNHFMGSRSREDQAMLSSFVRQTEPAFIRWSIAAILNWRQHELPANVIHIHGSRDRLLPVRYTRASHIVANGRHLMVLSKAPEINRILAEVLTNG